MENKKKRSPITIMVISFAVLIGFLVIALLNEDNSLTPRGQQIMVNLG